MQDNVPDHTEPPDVQAAPIEVDRGTHAQTWTAAHVPPGTSLGYVRMPNTLPC